MQDDRAEPRRQGTSRVGVLGQDHHEREVDLGSLLGHGLEGLLEGLDAVTERGEDDEDLASRRRSRHRALCRAHHCRAVCARSGHRDPNLVDSVRATHLRIGVTAPKTTRPRCAGPRAPAGCHAAFGHTGAVHIPRSNRPAAAGSR